MARKVTDELPTHYLQWYDKAGKRSGVWRVRLLNAHGYTKQDGKQYFTVIADPYRHAGLHLIPNVPEERLRLIVPSPAIIRMLADRYQLYVRKERGTKNYILYWRKKAPPGSPCTRSIEEVLHVDSSVLGDEAKLRAAVEDALRPEMMSPF